MPQCRRKKKQCKAASHGYVRISPQNAKRIRERLNPADPKKLEEEAAQLLKLLAGVPAVEEVLEAFNHQN